MVPEVKMELKAISKHQISRSLGYSYSSMKMLHYLWALNTLLVISWDGIGIFRSKGNSSILLLPEPEHLKAVTAVFLLWPNGPYSSLTLFCLLRVYVIIAHLAPRHWTCLQRAITVTPKQKPLSLNDMTQYLGQGKKSPWGSPNPHIWLLTVETNIITLIILRVIHSFVILNLRGHVPFKHGKAVLGPAFQHFFLCLRASPYLSFLKTVLLGCVALVIKMKDLKGHCKTQHPKL